MNFLRRNKSDSEMTTFSKALILNFEMITNRQSNLKFYYLPLARVTAFKSLEAHILLQKLWLNV